MVRAAYYRDGGGGGGGDSHSSSMYGMQTVALNTLLREGLRLQAAAGMSSSAALQAWLLWQLLGRAALHCGQPVNVLTSVIAGPLPQADITGVRCDCRGYPANVAVNGSGGGTPPNGGGSHGDSHHSSMYGVAWHLEGSVHHRPRPHGGGRP